jgi:hypothetical protein
MDIITRGLPARYLEETSETSREEYLKVTGPLTSGNRFLHFDYPVEFPLQILPICDEPEPERRMPTGFMRMNSR